MGTAPGPVTVDPRSTGRFGQAGLDSHLSGHDIQIAVVFFQIIGVFRIRKMTIYWQHAHPTCGTP